LVHVTSLDNDFYHFDPIRHRLTGERGGRTFRIGDRLKVQVTRVSLDDRKIDLRLVDDEGRAAPKPSHASPGGEATGAARRESGDGRKPGRRQPPRAASPRYLRR
jgi:ribonuclease R